MVVGGNLDPNLRCLVAAAERLGLPVETVATAVGDGPALCWDLQRDALELGGRVLDPRAVFIRHDVFTSAASKSGNANYRAFAWYTALSGWALAHPQVRCFNRGALHTQLNKPHVLVQAKACGLTIPDTLVTNDMEGLRRTPEVSRIVKPVTGGGYCKRLAELIDSTETVGGSAAAPAIVQGELVPPEVRVYVVEDQCIPFSVVSDSLDYRTSSATKVVPYEGTLDEELRVGLLELVQLFGLDFGAADFKTDPRSGRLVFLEFNTNPMFSAFDAASSGSLAETLCRAMMG